MADGNVFLSNLLQKSQELVTLGRTHAILLQKKYQEFVLHNPESVSKIESILRALSYILPGRFGASEALSELVFSASQLLTLLNDGIFREGKRKLICGVTYSCERYRILLCLTVVEYLEVFIELGASRLWGEAGKWIIVVILQIAKAALRFVLLFKYKSGIQRTPLIPPLDRSNLEKREEGEDTAGSGQEQEEAEPVEENEQADDGHTGSVWRGARSGRVVRSLSATPTGSSRSWKLPKDCSKTKRAIQPTELSSRRLFAESLYISRPLLHISSMFMFGQASWKPWLISCGVDVTSLAVMGDSSDLNEEERSELSRRTLLLLFYLLRSPFYDTYSKTRILGFLKFMSDTVPGLSFVLNPLLDYLPTWQKIYFYNWSS
ncbi:peroxisomal membrane protein PEX16-like [Oculina patagonica]